MSLFGAVEIGGTKTDVAVGTSPDDMSDPVRIETTTPSETLHQIVSTLQDHELDGIGVSCFGPLELTSGSISNTPKPGWTGTQIREPIAEACSTTVVVDSDVNGAALGEGRWGAAAGLARFAYMTVGTGIGVGVVIDGRTIGDGSGHPEAGHVIVKRLPGDLHEGSCPFHGDCLEGMASGPALEARFGSPGDWVSVTDEVRDLAVDYLAQGIRNLIYTLAPEIVIVGGGVSGLPAFHQRLQEATANLLNEYPTPFDVAARIQPPGLGARSGLAGALILAGAA